MTGGLGRSVLAVRAGGSMQKMMQQLIEDRWEMERGTLMFSGDRLDLALTPGALFEGTFTVFGSGNEGAYGYVTSTDRRMECLVSEFNGSEETIGYRFHGEYLEAGDVVNGAFRFVSNLGEYELPYTIRVEEVPAEISDLNHFAALARNDWEEALRLFYSRDFTRLLKGNDRKYTENYRGLSARPGNQHNMEEFLIACGKKQRNVYRVREEELSVANPTEMLELSVTVCKDGWGYTRLKVSTEGEFVFTEKEVITDDDFLGNQCTIPVYIDNSVLHRGRNFGCVKISCAGCMLEVPVKVMMGVSQGSYQSQRILKEQLIIDIMDCYQQYRLKLIAGTTWLDRTAGLVERLVAMNDKDVVSRLFQAQVLIMQERNHEAGWVLTHVMELMERQKEAEPASMAYYLYLTTMVNRDSEYVRRATAQIEDIYRKNRGSWKVAWLLLFLTPQLRRDPAARWTFLEKQFCSGCTSPIWYLESMLTLTENPALLRRLGEYEIQVLHYGARKGVLSAELKEQFLYLAGRFREFSPVLLRLLILCYEKETDERVLQEICAQLIKGGRTDKEAFDWYELGVEKELRITRLYEYYMMSMDLSAECPISRKALMYFAWQSSLDYEHTAYLYSYVLKHRQEYAELQQQYRERMERFVADQILKEHINKDLAYLYQELLSPSMLSGQLARSLSKLLFVHRISIRGGQETGNLSGVVVYRPDLDKVWRYPVTNGCAWAALYSDKDTVLLEDTEGNRYVTGISWSKEKLINPVPFLDAISMYLSADKQSDVEFDKYLWDRSRKQSELSADVVARGRRLLLSGEVSDFVKGRTQMRLLHHYRNCGDTRGLDAYLEEISWEVLDASSRREVLRSLVLRERMPKAYEWLGRFGPDEVDCGTLVRLCAWFVRQEQTAEDPVLTEAAMYAFRKGKYDGDVLRYLAAFYQGLLPELEDIRKASLSYGVDTWELCERMLVQMIFTRVLPPERTEVFRSYLGRDAKEQVISAFLAGCASEYLVKGEHQDGLIFREIGRMHREGQGVRDVEKLAYLKYFAEEEKNQEHAQNGVQDQPGEVRSEEIMQEFMRDLTANGIRLNFFRKIACCEKLWRTFDDKTIVEYQAASGSKVTMHYVITRADGTEDKPCVEEMAAAPGGIFFKEFVLFFGESVQYYFTVEQERQKEITQSFLLQKEERDESSTGRFHMINEILKNGSLEDYESMDDGLEDMYHKAYLSNRLFTMR